MKKHYKNILFSVLIGTIFLYLWSKIIDDKAFLSYFSNISISMVTTSLIFYFMGYGFRSFRWKILLSTTYNIPFKTIFSYVMAGNLINYLVPIRAGEVGKCVFLKKNYQIGFSKSFPSIFIDKLFDTFGIFIILAILPFINIEINKYLETLIILLLATFILGALILVMASFMEEKVIKFLQNLFYFFPKKYKEKIHDFIELFVQGTGIFKNHINLLPISIFLTLIAILADSLFFWFMFKAFSQDVNFIYVAFGYTLINLSFIFPQPPAQLGSNELIMILIFTIGMGLQKNMVSAVTAFSHIITGILIVVIGMICLSFAGTKFFEIIKNGDDNDK